MTEEIFWGGCKYQPNNIYNVDCYEAIKEIPDNSIDCVITSPPYDNLRNYNNNEIWTFEKFQLIANQLSRILKKGGVIVWIVSDQTVNGSESGTSFKQALYFKEIGLNIHDTMIWKKPSFTDTGSLKVRYGNSFEYMFIFVKEKLKTFNPIKDRKNIYSGTKIHGNNRLKNGKTKPCYSNGKTIKEYGQRFNVWEIATCLSNNERTGHPAQFPIQLVKDHIISWTNENEIILDCFLGSGTTAVAAKELGRKYIGFELSKKYFDVAQDRLNGISRIERKQIDSGIQSIFDFI